MAVTDREGRNIPFFIDTYEYHVISTEDFDPISDPSLDASELGVYTSKGFLIRPNADGDLYAIPWYDYHFNGDSLTGLVPVIYMGAQNQWVECRLIKVFAHNNAHYGSTCTAINVGITV